MHTSVSEAQEPYPYGTSNMLVPTYCTTNHHISEDRLLKQQNGVQMCDKYLMIPGNCTNCITLLVHGQYLWQIYQYLEQKMV
jgi:hypothetical protein